MEGRYWLSAEVYAAVAERGKFGETVDDVLRREFGLTPSKASASGAKREPSNGSAFALTDGRRGRGNHRLATNEMRARVEGGVLSVAFEKAGPKTWNLPSNKADREAVRRVRDFAIEFAHTQGATDGQIRAIMKVLSEAGYFVMGPKPRR